MAAITAAGKPIQNDPTAYAYFAIFDLGKGLVVLLVYAAARSRFGAGVKTAVWTGLIAWLASYGRLGDASLSLSLSPTSYQLPRSNIQDRDNPDPHRQPTRRVVVPCTNTKALPFHLQLHASSRSQNLCRILNNSFAWFLSRNLSSYH